MAVGQNDAAQDVIDGLAALPPDVRDILAERALKQAAQSDGSINEGGVAYALNDVTSTDRRRTIVFSTMTGEPHEILVIDRPRALRITRTDGKPAFWAPGMPGRPPKRNTGTLKCFLHPESDERAIVDLAGYAGRYCNDGDPSKKNVDNFQALDHKEKHEERKHPGAWKAVERMKLVIREREYQELQKAQLEAQREMAEAMKSMANQGNKPKKSAE